MTPFIAIGGAEPRPIRPILENGAFWPALDTHHFREVHRLGDTITYIRIEDALLSAAAITNRVLRHWQEKQTVARLEDVSAPPWMRKNGLLEQYLNAVYCEAHATLLDRHRDYDATAHGMQDNTLRADMAAHYRQNARWAVCEILNRPHTTVELI